MENKYLNLSRESLEFKLDQAQEELKSLEIDLFILNPRVGELTKEIFELREAIKAKED